MERMRLQRKVNHFQVNRRNQVSITNVRKFMIQEAKLPLHKLKSLGSEQKVKMDYFQGSRERHML